MSREYYSGQSGVRLYVVIMSSTPAAGWTRLRSRASSIPFSPPSLWAGTRLAAALASSASIARVSGTKRFGNGTTFQIVIPASGTAPRHPARAVLSEPSVSCGVL